MTAAVDLPRFNAYLRTQLPPIDSVEFATMSYLCAAATKQATLVGKIEDAIPLLTTQELMLFSLIQPAISAPVTKALLLAAIADNRLDLIAEAIRCGITPPWPWAKWAARFTGTEADLNARLRALIATPRELGAAAILATASPEGAKAIGTDLLSGLCLPEHGKAFHVLLWRALSGPNASQRAFWALQWLGTHLEVFLMGDDADALLSVLVRSCHPGVPAGLIADMLKPYQDSAGELTHVVLAQRYAAEGNAQAARELARGIRHLSTAYDDAQAILAQGAP